MLGEFLNSEAEYQCVRGSCTNKVSWERENSWEELAIYSPAYINSRAIQKVSPYPKPYPGPFKDTYHPLMS